MAYASRFSCVQFKEGVYLTLDNHTERLICTSGEPARVRECAFARAALCGSIAPDGRHCVFLFDFSVELYSVSVDSTGTPAISTVPVDKINLRDFSVKRLARYGIVESFGILMLPDARVVLWAEWIHRKRKDQWTKGDSNGKLAVHLLRFESREHREIEMDSEDAVVFAPADRSFFVGNRRYAYEPRAGLCSAPCMSFPEIDASTTTPRDIVCETDGARVPLFSAKRATDDGASNPFKRVK